MERAADLSSCTCSCSRAAHSTACNPHHRRHSRLLVSASESHPVHPMMPVMVITHVSPGHRPAYHAADHTSG
eukprot:3174468-Rhodomonas_salina.2